MSKSVPAIILCGGLGTRLQAVLGSVPKALAPIAGRPFLDYQLQFLRCQGIIDIVLAVGVGASQVEACYGDGSQIGMKLRYSHEKQPLGTGGAAKKAAALCSDDLTLVLNGDTLVRFDVEDLLASHRELAGVATLGLIGVQDRSRFGAVELNEPGAVVAFGEKGRAGPGAINAGVYVLSRQVLAGIALGRAVSLESEVFPGYVGRGLFGTVVAGPFLDIGTPESYAAAERFLADWGAA